MTIRDWLSRTTAADLMTSPVVAISPEMTVEEAAAVLQREQITAAPVVDVRGVCVGVFSASDLIPLSDAGTGGNVSSPASRVRDLMTRALISVEWCVAAGDIVRIMLDGNVHRVFVLDDEERLAGVISMSDLLDSLLTTSEPEGHTAHACLNAGKPEVC